MHGTSLADDRSRSGRLEGAARAELIEAVSTAAVKRLFLDYDGTLTPIRRNPALATPTPDLLALLQDLGRRPDFDVTIITGRSREFCDQYFGEIDLNLVAEHCAFYRRKGGGGWESVVSAEEFERIKAVVRPTSQLRATHSRRLRRRKRDSLGPALS